MSDEQGHYYVNVVAGEIQITKNVNKLTNQNLEGNPIFTFKIEYTAPNADEVSKTYYRTIEFNEANDTSKNAEKLSDLPRGTYTITELSTQKYDFVSVSGADSNCKVNKSKDGKSISFEIGTNGDGNSSNEAKVGKATFSNSKTGPSTNTDTDVVVNRFVKTENGWTIKQITQPGEGQREETPKENNTSENK